MYRLIIKIAVVLALFLGTYSTASAVAIMVPQGGTGSTTLTGVLIGNGTSPVQSVIIGSNLTLSGTTLSASITGGSGDPFAFTQAAYGVSTSTIVGFLGGLFSVGSSTIQTLSAGTITIPSLLSGGLGVDSSGLVYKAATTTFSTGLTYTNGVVTNSGVTSIAASAPLVNSLSTGDITLTCPTCAVFAYPFPNAATSTLLTLSGGITASGGTATFGTLAGALDAGGATSFEIPNGTGPTVDAIGEIALDTTASMGGQLLIATSTNATFPGVFPIAQELYKFSFASTSQKYASTSAQLPSKAYGFTIWNVFCNVEGGTSVAFVLSDANGTNDTESVTASRTMPTDGVGTVLSANNTWTAGEEIRVEWGSKTGVIDWINCTLYGQPTRQ